MFNSNKISPLQELIQYIDKYASITGPAGELIREKAVEIRDKREELEFNEAHRVGMYNQERLSKGESIIMNNSKDYYSYKFYSNPNS